MASVNNQHSSDKAKKENNSRDDAENGESPLAEDVFLVFFVVIITALVALTAQFGLLGSSFCTNVVIGVVCHFFFWIAGAGSVNREPTSREILMIGRSVRSLDADECAASSHEKKVRKGRTDILCGLSDIVC